MSPSEIDRLFNEMVKLVPLAVYPSGVVTVKERIAGTAFFPGGSGLFLEGREKELVQFPRGGVMVLGHNFDNETGYKRSLLRGKENLKSPTWRSLIELLKAADIPLNRCFFTNAFMGLCRDESNLRYRGGEDEKFREACRLFLQFQIGFQRPRLILTLGRFVPPMLAELTPHHLSAWNSRILTFGDIDKSPIFMSAPFELPDGSTHRAAVVALTHPSMPNAWRRNPKDHSIGKQGEIELVRAKFLRIR